MIYRIFIIAMMVLGAVPSMAQSELEDSLSHSGSNKCPIRARITAEIGDFDSQVAAGAGFLRLAGTTVTVEFKSSRSAHTSAKTGACVLVETRGQIATFGTAKHRYFEIRRHQDGSQLILFEGYTVDGKLYSIRSSINGADDLNGSFDASLYDGSGPGHLRLAPAILTITDLEY